MSLDEDPNANANVSWVGGKGTWTVYIIGAPGAHACAARLAIAPARGWGEECGHDGPGVYIRYFRFQADPAHWWRCEAPACVVDRQRGPCNGPPIAAAQLAAGTAPSVCDLTAGARVAVYILLPPLAQGSPAFQGHAVLQRQVRPPDVLGAARRGAAVHLEQEVSHHRANRAVRNPPRPCSA